MLAVTSLIVVLLLSLLVVRIAAEALILTGLSREAAKFQARSAWTGTGFTTEESEAVVTHPVRRRIVSTLMLLRSAGLVTAASTLMLTFVNVEDRSQGFLRLVIMMGGVIALFALARSAVVDRWLSRTIARALKRHARLDVHDYAGLLHLAGEYAIMELMVTPDSWLADRTLGELNLPAEGVLVLGLTRKAQYFGAPRADTVVRPGDTLVLYGRSPELTALGHRRADSQADQLRESAVRAQSGIREAEKRAESEQ